MTQFLISLLVAAALQNWPKLSTELQQHHLPPPKDAVDLEQQITSYSTFDDAAWFIIAYYDVVPDGLLQDLKVRSFDKRARMWRSATFQEIGSVLSIQRHAGLTYVGGHSSPSAGPLLVLSDNLRVKRDLDGWTKLFLDDGRVVFERSVVHFAPAHGGALALYDPAGDREQSLYPPPGVHNERGIEKVPGTDLLMDRSFGEVKKGKAPGTIEFVATEQRMRLTPQNSGEAAGPEQRLLVVCNVAGRRPACTSRISE